MPYECLDVHWLPINPLLNPGLTDMSGSSDFGVMPFIFCFLQITNSTVVVFNQITIPSRKLIKPGHKNESTNYLKVLLYNRRVLLS